MGNKISFDIQTIGFYFQIMISPWTCPMHLFMKLLHAISKDQMLKVNISREKKEEEKNDNCKLYLEIARTQNVGLSSMSTMGCDEHDKNIH